MKKAIIGKKLGMTQVFTSDGQVVPVTVVEAGPCTVVQKKTTEKEGYDSVVVAFEEAREKLINKPQMGIFKKASIAPCKTLKELRLDSCAEREIGNVIKADIFTEGDMVDVSGVTRGRGFTGCIARWNQHRLKMTHGTGPVHRQVGSMGANTTPGHVFKNKRMPGHYGQEKVTIQNLQIVKVDAERNLLLVKGCVPGARGSLVFIRDAKKA
ncbi:MAG: 50S ribosomal protein L3 [Clostridia bacterium]